MLYLAEVHKKTGFMGAKTELKLLAQKQSEHNWSPISGEELLQADAANDYNAGVLVLVEMDGNQQFKSIQDATRQLVVILKSFSRMREKFKTQEEEIEGWKQSLIYQSQELTRREVDMEARAEEIQEWEAESQKIEQQRQEFEATRTQILQLKEQMEQDRQQLEEGWGRLQNAQNEAANGLSDEQVHQIEQLLDQLDSDLSHGISNPEQLHHLQAAWQTLEQDRSQAQQQQATLDQKQSELQTAWQEWRQTQDSLAQTQLELKVQEQSVISKSEQKKWFSEQLLALSKICEQLNQIQGGVGDQADMQALREMPLEELEATVEKLNTELAKLSSFVNDQEEELNYQQQAITELEAKIQNASEYDQLSLTGELEDERQHFRLLDETLEGQRKTLKEREAILYFHQDILYQRKRSQQNQFHQTATLDLDPALQLAKAEREQQQQALERLNQELKDLESSLQITRTTIETTAAEQENKQTALRQQEQDLENQKNALAELWGKIKTAESLLQPIQHVLGQTGEDEHQSDSPVSALNELKQVFMAIGQGG